MKINRRGFVQFFAATAIQANVPERKLEKIKRGGKNLSAAFQHRLDAATAIIDDSTDLMRSLAKRGLEAGCGNIDTLSDWPDERECSEALLRLLASIAAAHMQTEEINPMAIDLALLNPATIDFRKCDPAHFVA